MGKTRTQFLCNQCGSVHPKWMGKCPDCGTWDALEQFTAPTPDPRAGARAAPAQTADIAHGVEPLALDQIDEAESPRRPTRIGEFDRILGGGIVPGSAVLIGGEPGIGKSTLLLQVANELAKGRTESKKKSSTQSSVLGTQSSRVLYVTSEESARQTKLR